MENQQKKQKNGWKKYEMQGKINYRDCSLFITINYKSLKFGIWSHKKMKTWGCVSAQDCFIIILFIINWGIFYFSHSFHRAFR